MRRDVKFEEERAFRKSRESEQGEQQVLAPYRQLYRYHQRSSEDHRFPELQDHTMQAQVHQGQWFNQ